MDRKVICQLSDQGPGGPLLDESVDLPGREPRLLLPHGSRTVRGSTAAFSAITRGRNAVTSPFGV